MRTKFKPFDITIKFKTKKEAIAFHNIFCNALVMESSECELYPEIQKMMQEKYPELYHGKKNNFSNFAKSLINKVCRYVLTSKQSCTCKDFCGCKVLRSLDR